MRSANVQVYNRHRSDAEVALAALHLVVLGLAVALGIAVFLV